MIKSRNGTFVIIESLTLLFVRFAWKQAIVRDTCISSYGQHTRCVLHYLKNPNVFKNVFHWLSDNKLFTYSVFIMDVLNFIIHSIDNSNIKKRNVKLFS